MLVGYHGAALDLVFWLPRGAAMLEIYPKGSTHTPLYAAKVCVFCFLCVLCAVLCCAVCCALAHLEQTQNKK